MRRRKWLERAKSLLIAVLALTVLALTVLALPAKTVTDTPWLAALYVDEEFRSQGLGHQLQAFVLEQSRRSGFREVYLYAEFTGYYERFGWQYIGDALDYPDKPVHLFRQFL